MPFLTATGAGGNEFNCDFVPGGIHAYYTIVYVGSEILKIGILFYALLPGLSNIVFAQRRIKKISGVSIVGGHQ